MNEISFVVAPDEFGAGAGEGLEPVIDGVSLVDILKWADGEIEHLGLTEVDRSLRDLRDLPPPGSSRVVRVLGCLCGIDDCSNVTTTVSTSDVAITWSDIKGQSAYADVGPFSFEPERYLAAVARPTRAAGPVREPVDVEQLAAGLPRDPAAWLRSMTMAFGRDFFTPFEPDLPREVAARGARAFAQTGMPVSDEVVREWARGRRFTAEAIERYVSWFHELAEPPESN